MKLFSIFTLTFVLSASATSFSQKQQVSLNLKQCDLHTLFQEIWKQTGLRFVYNEKDIKGIQRQDIKANEQSVEEILNDIFRATPYQASFESDVIYIILRPAVPQTQAQAQKEMVKLSGTVTDPTGHPLPGVTVCLGNTNTGTATDIDGNYQLSIAKGSKVEITYSFVGMQKAVFLFDALTDKRHNVTLREEIVQLQNVVVIGYGTKSKRDVTSSVSSVSAKDMEKYNNGTATFDNLMGGAIKGVLVQQSSGTPGSASTINIRGITSPVSGSTNEPLYVIDGVPFFLNKNPNMLNPLMTLSPNDIQSIDVLKDAAATSIYGSRGANGVIIVNTVSGQRNQEIKISAGYTLSVGNPVKKFNPLNRTEFIRLQDRIIRNTISATERGQLDPNRLVSVPGFMDQETAEMSKIPYIDLGVRQEMDANGNLVFKYNKINEDYFGKANTNWVDEIQNKNAITHQYNVGVRGGSERTNYSFSFNGTNQEGIFINEKLERYGVRLALDSDISKRFRTGVSLNYTYSKRNLGSDIYGYVTTTQEWVFRPDIPVKKKDGSWGTDNGTLVYGRPGILANPVAGRGKQNKSNSSQFMGSANLEYKIIDNLRIRGDINISIFNDHGSWFTPTYATDDFRTPFGQDPWNGLRENASQTANSSVTFRADYDLNIGKHLASFMAGYAWDRIFLNQSAYDFSFFPDDYILTNISSAGKCDKYSGSKSRSGLNSVFARASYNYDEKYLAEFNFRSDASSKFGPGNKRAYFPAFSLGWRMSQEKFSINFSWLNDLKFRFSIGQTGSTNVDDFTYLQFFTRSSGTIYEEKPGIIPNSTYPNKDVKWEMTTEYNGGIDFSLFDYRLFGSIDAYSRFTSGALSPSPFSYETGATTFYSNLMDMSNKGMEFEIGGDIIRKKEVTWTSRFNISFNRNKVVSFNNADLNPFQLEAYQEGKPAGILKGYVVEKIFQTDEEVAVLNQEAHVRNSNVDYYQEASTGAGDYKYKDIDGNGVINNDDKTIIASPEPQFFGGFMNTVSYKNFNLSVVFQFSKGTKALMPNLYASGNLGQSILREIYGNTWTPENKDARYARLVYSDPNKNNRTSDRYVFNTSYLRLKNISLSYIVPQTFLHKWNIQSAMIFASVSNIWTLTKWPGLDPEALDSNSGIAGYTSNDDPYPLSKAFSIGVKLEF